jgi:hypothetical protein
MRATAPQVVEPRRAASGGCSPAFQRIATAFRTCSGTRPRPTFRVLAPQTNPDAAAGFFAALDARGSKLVRSTLVKPPFYGGSVDAHGNAYVLVNVFGADVMATAGAFDRSFNGGSDMFVMALGCEPGRAAAGTSRAACDRPDAARGP